jgi:hypothetical protein
MVPKAKLKGNSKPVASKPGEVRTVITGGEPTRQTHGPEGTEHAVCPNCGHHFWHKLLHGVEKVAEGVAEVPVDVIAKNSGFGGDE